MRLVGKAVVELLEVLRVTLLFQAGISIVPCSNSSDFPLLSLLLIARASYPCLAYRIGWRDIQSILFHDSLFFLLFSSCATSIPVLCSQHNQGSPRTYLSHATERSLLIRSLICDTAKRKNYSFWRRTRDLPTVRCTLN